MSQQQQDEPISTKAWKIKIERVQKGYVRVTVHGDSVDDVMHDWNDLHMALKQDGEVVERLQEPKQEGYEVIIKSQPKEETAQ
jgi:hypothetical protein